MMPLLFLLALVEVVFCVEPGSDSSLPAFNNHGIIELTPQTWQAVVMNEKYDVVVEFYSPYCSYCQALEPTWNELGDKFKKEDSVIISKIDYSNPSNYIDGFQIRGVPHILIFPAKKKGSPVVFQNQRTLNNFIQYIMDNVDHKVDVPIHHRSLPKPTSNDGPVTTVVGETWQEIVMNKEKHVFVNFFAPWCPYSQRLKPIWADLAAKMKEHTSLVIADFDGTENEVPGLVLHAFPTTTLYKANDKSGVQFRGPTRSVEAYEEWLRAQIPDAFAKSTDTVGGLLQQEKENKEVLDKHQQFDDLHLVKDISEDEYFDLIKSPNANIAILLYADWDENKENQKEVWDDVALEYQFIHSVQFYQMEASKSQKLGLSVFPEVRIFPTAKQSHVLQELLREVDRGNEAKRTELVHLASLAGNWHRERSPGDEPPSLRAVPKKGRRSWKKLSRRDRENVLESASKFKEVEIPQEIKTTLFGSKIMVEAQTFKGKEFSIPNLMEFIQSNSNPTESDLLLTLLAKAGVKIEASPQKRTTEQAFQSMIFKDDL